MISQLTFYIDLALDTLNKVFNNREIAIGFWLMLFIFFVSSNIKLRRELIKIIRLILESKLVLLFILIIIYIGGLVYFLYWIGFWEMRMLKGTIFWLLGAGLILPFRAVEAKNKTFFINVIKDNTKLFIVFQFVVNLFTFSFITEVIIVFIITVVTMLITVLSLKPEDQDENGKRTKRFLEILLSIVGFVILFQSVKMIINSFDNIVINEVIRDFLLPSILSMLYLIFIYLFALYSSYEVLFMRLKFKHTIPKRYRPLLYMKIVLLCNVKLDYVTSFISRSKIMNTPIQDKRDINKIVNCFKNNNNHIQEFTLR
ncbi:hypothetical protein [Radiobacillus sp. PE A8.2]|uniref:hypothetical protein n=1 Tax=Radiobacillus sp. PE A8.2 TaxID=3380349 RepID=UPI00388F4B78